MGLYKRPKNLESIFDNFEFGKAYLANAILTLTLLELDKREYNFWIKDALIFPILFDVWHSIELLLKSGIAALCYVKYDSCETIRGHDIFLLKERLYDELSGHQMLDVINCDLIPLDNLIAEFERVKPSPDFSRYSFTSNENYQFYKAPSSDKKQWQSNGSRDKDTVHTVPNTCVDTEKLLETLISIAENALLLFRYFTDCLSEDEEISFAGFESYKREPLNVDDKYEGEDQVEIILSFISNYIK